MSNGANQITLTQSTLLKLLIRRGSDIERRNIVLSEGELGYAVDTTRLFIGDGATSGGNPVSYNLFYGSVSPNQYTQAVIGDLAFDADAGALYRLTTDNPADISNWTVFLGAAANRVDGTTIKLEAYNGTKNVLQVNTISAAQIDDGVAGVGLEKSGTTIQTTAAQEFDTITTRNSTFLRIPATLKFGNVGGATAYNLPQFDGPNGYSMVTDGNGTISWKPGNSITQYLVLSGNQVPVGTILQYGSGGSIGNEVSAYEVPYGYFICDGRTLNGVDYPELSAAISTYYGTTGTNTFSIPNLSSSDYVYIIKYLEDSIIYPTTISFGESLSCWDVTAAEAVTSFETPQSELKEYLIRVPDYVSKTYVDTLFNSIGFENTVLTLPIMSEVNGSNGSNSPGYFMFIDRRNNHVIYSGIDHRGSAGLGYYRGGDYYNLEHVPIEFDDADEIPVQIYGANGTTFVLTNSGNVYSSGENIFGRSGQGSGELYVTNFVKVEIPSAAGKVTKISVGGSGGTLYSSNMHVFALTESGSAFAWGYNGFGQCGLNSTTTQFNSPVNVNANSLSGLLIRNIYSFCGNTYNYSFAIDTLSAVHYCGYNGRGNLGNGTTTDVITGWTQSVHTADEIYSTVQSNGSVHSTFLLSGGKLWSTGYNGVGQLGINSTSDVTTFTPVCADGTTNTQLTGVSTISCSDNSRSTIMALMTDNTIRTWGYNIDGACGIGNNTNVLAPTAAFSGDFTNSGIIKIKAHGYDARTTLYALNSSGEIWGAGENIKGELGIGNNTASTIFVKAKQPYNIKYSDFFVGRGTDANNKTVFAITSGGELYTWGEYPFQHHYSQNFVNNIRYNPVKVDF